MIEEIREWEQDHPLVQKAYLLRRKSRIFGQPSMSTKELEEWLEEEGEYAFCYYCGTPLDLENTRQLDGFTIDRLNPKKGYTKSNIVPCCRRCNIIKGNWFTPKQMKEIAKKYL